MGRGEKEDVSNLDLPDPLNPEITFYDTKGQRSQIKTKEWQKV